MVSHYEALKLACPNADLGEVRVSSLAQDVLRMQSSNGSQDTPLYWLHFENISTCEATLFIIAWIILVSFWGSEVDIVFLCSGGNV